MGYTVTEKEKWKRNNLSHNPNTFIPSVQKNETNAKDTIIIVVID